MNNQIDINAFTKIIKWVVLGLVILILFFGSFSIIQAGEVGVVTRFGAVNRVAYPGIAFKIPIIESISQMDTRTQKDQVDAQAASKDLQAVKSTIAVNYHLEGNRAVEVFQNIGIDYQNKVVSPAIQEAFKATTAKFTAEQLITQREKVRSLAQDDLIAKVSRYHIIVDNFNIVNFDFSDEFNRAVEQKQVAQQGVETAKQNLAKIQIEAQQALAQGQGQANAQKALREAGSLSPEYLQYLAITKWNGVLPQYTGGTIPFVNIR